MISHVDEKLVEEVLKDTEEYFGKRTATRGDRHVSLDMNFLFDRDNWYLEINMINQLTEATKEFPDSTDFQEFTHTGRHCHTSGKNFEW